MGELLEQTKYQMNRIANRHILKLWFVRGVLLAISTLTLVTNVTEIEKFDFLRFVHALIFSWNNLLEIFGKILGFIPFIPDVPASIMNLWVLSVVIGTGAFETIHKSIVKFREGLVPNDDTLFYERPELRERRFILEGLSAVFLPFFILLGTYYMFVFLINSSTQSLVFSLVITMGLMLVIPAASTFLFLSLKDLVGLINRHPAYKAGILCTFGLLTGFEILYLLNLPYISDLMENFSNAVLGENP